MDRLVSIPATLSYAAGLLRVYGAGGVGFYAGRPLHLSGGQQRTLAAVGSNYQYTAPDGSTINFNSVGLETSSVSPDGQATITYSYSGSNLTGVATPTVP